MTFYQITLILATFLTGLVAGLFYAYQCSVIGGLGKLDDKAYLTAFQHINRVILNPWFFSSFMGCMVVLPVAAWLSNSAGTQSGFYLLLAAAIVYVVGVFGVTIFCNVPLNNALEKFNINGASTGEIHKFRKFFEPPWNRYNLIRTVASAFSFLLCILSMLKNCRL